MVVEGVEQKKVAAAEIIEKTNPGRETGQEKKSMVGEERRV